MKSSFSFRRFGVSRRAYQAPRPSVVGGILRHDVFTHRDLRPVLLDQGADVVARGLERKPGERTCHRDARGERGVLVHRQRFPMAGDGHDALLGFGCYRALRAQVVEVRIRIGDEGRFGEEVDSFEVTHVRSPIEVFWGTTTRPSKRNSGEVDITRTAPAETSATGKPGRGCADRRRRDRAAGWAGGRRAG